MKGVIRTLESAIAILLMLGMIVILLPEKEKPDFQNIAELYLDTVEYNLYYNGEFRNAIINRNFVTINSTLDKITHNSGLGYEYYFCDTQCSFNFSSKKRTGFYGRYFILNNGTSQFIFVLFFYKK